MMVLSFHSFMHLFIHSTKSTDPLLYTSNSRHQTNGREQGRQGSHFQGADSKRGGRTSTEPQANTRSGRALSGAVLAELLAWPECSAEAQKGQERNAPSTLFCPLPSPDASHWVNRTYGTKSLSLRMQSLGVSLLEHRAGRRKSRIRDVGLENRRRINSRGSQLEKLTAKLLEGRL